MPVREQRGTILVYAILLVNFAVILGYIIFLKSETLLENTRYAQMNSKLTKNIEERANASMDYNLAMNRSGSGFTNTVSCPTLTMSGTNVGSTYSESIVTTPAFDGTTAYCTGPSASYPGQNIRLDYSPNYLSFSGAVFRSGTANLTGSPTMTGILSDTESTRVTLTLGALSGIDANFNSDNYQPYSTGSVQYPSAYEEDDDLARKIVYGYVRKDNIWRNVFWNTATTADKIRKNSNNTGSLAVFPDQTSSGMLRLDLDTGYSIRIIELEPAAYTGSKEIRIQNTLTTSSNTGSIGYLQTDMSVSSGSTNAKLFDLKNKNYAIFLSSSGSASDFLKYKYYFENQSGSMVYTVPLDDSNPYQMTYYGNDIIIDDENIYIPKEQEMTRPK